MKPEKKAAEMTVSELAKYIDYSVLKPEFTEEEIIRLTKDGVQLGCATICINPGYIKLCEPYVKGSETMLCPVADFPFGTASTESRVAQIKEAGESEYVKEIDVVVNFGKLRAGKYEEVTEDLREAKLTLEESTARAEELREEIARLEKEIESLRESIP